MDQALGPAFLLEGGDLRAVQRLPLCQGIGGVRDMEAEGVPELVSSGAK